MTLPVYGNSLSMSQIKGEFGPVGSPANVALGDYYAGGAYVSPGTVGFPNGGGAVAIPTNGTISINNFFGATFFTPVTNTYTSGSGNEIVPTGALSLTITVVGAGGTGGSSYVDFGSDIYNSGGGGGGAGYSTITRAVASGDWGTTIAYSVGTSGGVDSTTTGSIAAGAVSLTGGGGGAGGSADSGSGGAGGTAGTASGGSTNTSGSAGSSGSDSSSSGNPGGAGGASGGTAYGYGANGADSPGSAGSVGGGVVTFAWT
jgi:hypothetical protein